MFQENVIHSAQPQCPDVSVVINLYYESRMTPLGVRQ